MKIHIRKATEADIPALVSLSHQLGYPVSAEECLQNLLLLMENPHEAVLVAATGENVVGWMGIVGTQHLCAGPSCQVSGLVIDEKMRGRGIGKLMLAAAEQWAQENGFNRMKVYCNTRRKEAHAFYSASGFTEQKEQKVFTRAIG